MKTLMAKHIKAVIPANLAPENKAMVHGRDLDTNTRCVVGQHITSAAPLPDGHPVRLLLATAAVEGYIRRDKHTFLKEIRESSNFAVDLLLEVK